MYIFQLISTFTKTNKVKKYILLCALLFPWLALLAQDPSQSPSTATTNNSPNSNRNSSALSDRLFLGGDFGMQFGTQTLIQIAPLLGYRLTDEFSVGLTGKYIYYSLKDSYSNFNYKTNIYGGGLFTRYNITEELFLHAEYEALSLEVPNLYYELNRRVVSGLFIGGGYRQFIGNFSSLNIMLLYDVISDQYSPYQNPIIRVGFDFGL